MIGIAAGAALSIKLLNDDRVVICFFGDGAANQGILLEAMNMAAIWRLPVIYLCENNQFGEYSRWQDVTAGERIASRGQPFGIPSQAVDGMDALAVYEATKQAVDRARGGQGPSLIEAMTYRYRGHHVGDVKTPYRTEQELEEWKSRDPIRRLRAQLQEEEIATEGEITQLEKKIERAIDEAIEFGKNSALPPVEEVGDHVYA
jgi:pyruvate dehydrogenase E1 component alpha subunit